MSFASSDSPSKRSFPPLKLFSRLVLVLGGSALALGGGIVIAQYYPSPSPQMPLIEAAFQYSEQGWATGWQQIERWMGRTPTEKEKATSTVEVFPVEGLRITLPSDVLFKEGQSALRPNAQDLLSTVLAELRTYPGATIRIAAHTDDLGEASDNRELSFRQAQSLRLYLEANLGTGYRWVVLGYGGSDPLVENRTDANRQRNRRTEIAIGPR